MVILNGVNVATKWDLIYTMEILRDLNINIDKCIDRLHTNEHKIF